jgi:hypothetical protein
MSKSPWNLQTPETQTKHAFTFLERRFEAWKDLRGYFFDGRENLSLLECVFRGHADAGWKLQPCLERISPRNDYGKTPGIFQNWYNDAEKYSIDHFQTAFRHFATKEAFPKEDPTLFDWLSVMQHHGAQTRLLDVSRSPFIASYFAIADTAMTFPREVCIWVFRESDLARANAVLLGTIADDPFGTRSYAEDVRFDGKAEKNFISINAPRRPTMRQFRQQGGFIFTIDNSAPFEEVLGKYQEIDVPFVEKLVLNLEYRSQQIAILQELRMLNISHSSLFPDLDGYSREVAIHQYIVNT